MLGKPFAGWTDITVNGEYLGRASYLEWIPGLVLDPCIRYMQASADYDFMGGGHGLNIEFDGEDKGSFGLVEIGGRIYSYDYSGDADTYVNLIKPVSNYGDGTKFVRNLIAEVISDIEENYEDWVLWDVMTDDEEEYQQNKRDLDEILAEAKKCLK